MWSWSSLSGRRVRVVEAVPEAGGRIVTIDLHHSCTSSHTGTSASAPLAAGICALALQANTNLTWRDMQHIVVRTARPQNLIASDWATNGVGRNVSHSFGYGLMDAGAMVKLARVWKTVPEQNKCEIRAPQIEKNIPPKSKVTLDLKVTNCPGVNFLEHVQAKVTLTSQRRGDLQIYLVSPLGTRSTLLAHRRYDMNRAGFTDWPFMTVHSWGESPIGKWTLEIHNEGRFAGRTVLKRWSLIAYGTETDSNSPESPSPANGNYNREGSSSSPSPPIRYPAVINLSYLNNKTSPAYYTPRNKVGGRKDGVVDFSNSTLHNFQSQGGAAAAAESRNVSLGVGGQTDGPGPGTGSGGSGNGQKGGKNNTRQGFKARLKLHSKKQKGASPPPSGSQSEESQESQRPHTRLVTEAPSGGGGAAAPESIDSNQAANKLAERAKFSNQSVITGSKYSKEKALNSSKEATQIQHTNPTNVGRDTETRKKSQGKGNDKLESVKDVAAGDSGMGEMNGESMAKLSSALTVVTHSGQGLERASESRQLPNATTREVNGADANSFTSTSEDSRDGTQSRDNLQGKLQTWTLVAHGIESNPNGNGNKSSEASGTGSVVGANASGSSSEGERQPVDSAKDVENVEVSTGIGKEADLAKASHGGGEFDGGDNGIAMPPKQVASLPLGVESALPTDLSSASSSATSAFCAKMSVNGQCLGWCLFILLYISMSFGKTSTSSGGRSRCRANSPRVETSQEVEENENDEEGEKEESRESKSIQEDASTSQTVHDSEPEEPPSITEYLSSCNFNCNYDAIHVRKEHFCKLSKSHLRYPVALSSCSSFEDVHCPSQTFASASYQQVITNYVRNKPAVITVA